MIFTERDKLINYLAVGVLIGTLFGYAEYILRIKTNNEPQALIPLLIRSAVTGAVIISSVLFFEALFRGRFMKRPFLYVVVVRAFFYTMIITIWLFTINGVWFAINGRGALKEEFAHYLNNSTYLVNVVSIFLVLLMAVGLSQIDSLHRRGELINFVFGKYHSPKEVELIFCFIDLKGSTTIGERLGHFRFAMFLKDYYSDITEALRNTNAQIYQYVGDEIILSWSYKNGLRNNNLVRCYFQMKQIINDKKQEYIYKYGAHPEFRAGLHGGKVIVTWVGEMKKEIVYLGDVLNTTSRIQEDCKRLGKEFLISEELLRKISNPEKFKAAFVEETIPRGREASVRLYSLELAD